MKFRKEVQTDFNKLFFKKKNPVSIGIVELNNENIVTNFLEKPKPEETNSNSGNLIGTIFFQKKNAIFFL